MKQKCGNLILSSTQIRIRRNLLRRIRTLQEALLLLPASQGRRAKSLLLPDDSAAITQMIQIAPWREGLGDNLLLLPVFDDFDLNVGPPLFDHINLLGSTTCYFDDLCL